VNRNSRPAKSPLAVHYRKPGDFKYQGKSACRRLVRANHLTSITEHVTCHVCQSYVETISLPKLRSQNATERRTTKDGIAARAKQIFKEMGL